jgi:competence protein ComEC
MEQSYEALQLMVKPCLLLLAGGLAAQHNMLPVSSDQSSLLLVASICMLARRSLRSAALILFGFALFMLAGEDIIAKRLHPTYAGDSMLSKVRIVDFPRSTGGSVVMTVEPVGDQRLPPRSRVSWFEPLVVPAIGEVWELELRLRRPRGNFNPGVFDYESWLFREKHHATGYVVGGKRNRLLWGGAASGVDKWREQFAAQAQAASESEGAAAVLAAIGVGVRHLVSREQWDRFAVSGTSHLMAISGLHVGLAALTAFLVAFAILGAWPLASNTYVVAMIAGVVCAALYALISGFGVPARRAVVMLLVAALAVARRRQVDAGAAVAVAAVIVFVTDPITTLTPGFHLSFAAVVLLLWLARHRVISTGRWKVLNKPRQLVVMQVFLLFGLAPLTAIIFQRLSVMATPVNLVAVPLFSLVTVPLTLGGLVVSDLYEPAALYLLRLAAHSIDFLESYIALMADIPFADATLAQIHGYALLIVLVPLAWVLLPPGWPGRRVAVLGLAALLTWRPAMPPAGCFDAWTLDVGQGLSVAVQTRDSTLLYDTGMAWRSGGSVAEQVILPFLRSRSIKHIDWLVISHADLDHSGGTFAISDKLGVGNVLYGEQLPGISGRRCRSGQGWQSSGVNFTFLHPALHSNVEGNASSCVLRVTAGSYGLLLTGDIEAASERALIQSQVPLAADVVIVPHHGSTTSSTVPFVNSVQADYAIVSAGHANRWGFPKSAVVARWSTAGAEVLNTASSGAVRFRVCASGGVVEMEKERSLRRRFWHAAT